MFALSAKILIVDDLSSLRELLKAYLRRIGYKQISEAADGREAYQQLVTAKTADAPFDLVICDWNMPNMNGLELLKAVRANAEWKQLPFVLLTTESEKDKVMEAVVAGASNYMVKPIDEKVLVEKLERAFQKHFPAGKAG